MKAFIIPPDGIGYELELSGELKGYQDAAGGTVDALPFGEKCSAIINDEGKLLGLPTNHVATTLCHKLNSIYPSDYICGPMVVVGNSDDGEWIDIPADMVMELSLPF